MTNIKGLKSDLNFEYRIESDENVKNNFDDRTRTYRTYAEH